jgi:TPR repeat protein
MAAQKGFLPALAWYGMMMVHGKGVPQEVERGKDIIRQAADRGYKRALFYLGRIAEDGTGGRVDMAEAFRNFRLAGEAGDVLSSLKTARMLTKGIGCTRAPEAAAIILRKLIADTKATEAFVQYGILLATGDGVKQDLQQAEQLLTIAARQGSQEAIEWLRRIANAHRQSDQNEVFARLIRGFL